MSEKKKKCPFCAEEIKADAKKCRFCNEWLNVEKETPVIAKSFTLDNASNVDGKRLLKIVGILFLFLPALVYWYVSIPIFFTWLFLFKTNIGKEFYADAKIKAKEKVKEMGYEKIAAWLLVISIVIIAFSDIILYWYISIPIFFIGLFLFGTNKGNKFYADVKEKLKEEGLEIRYGKIAVWMFVIMMAVIVFLVIFAYPDREPNIKIIEPKNNYEIQSDKVLIKGTVSPSGKNVSLRTGEGDKLEVANGHFEFEASLENEVNEIVIKAFNKKKMSSALITVRRIFTQEEKDEIEKKKQVEKDEIEKKKEAEEKELEKKKQAELEAKKKADEEKKIKDEEDAKIRKVKEAEEAKIREAEEAEEQKEEEARLINEEKDYKASCTSISYNKLEKSPYSFMGERVYYKGKIEQAGSQVFSEWFRISITAMGYGYYSDTIWVDYDDMTEFVTDDVVRFWGESTGQHCYKSQMGLDICIPSVEARYISK